MSKEPTPLETSKRLKEFVLEFIKNSLDRRFVIGSFDIIETELKNYAELKTTLNKKFVVALPRISNKTSVIDELVLLQKVLMIIKDNVYLDVNGDIMPKNKSKTKEQIDLLKEVLV